MLWDGGRLREVAMLILQIYPGRFLDKLVHVVQLLVCLVHCRCNVVYIVGGIILEAVFILLG